MKGGGTMGELALELRMTLRLFFGGEKCFGPGPAALLEATDRLGSLLEREAGGRRGGGSRLTKEGRDLLAGYRELERRMDQEGTRLLRELLPQLAIEG